MNNQLNDFVKNAQSVEFATRSGRQVHAKLQGVRIGPAPSGDADLVAKIMQSGSELSVFFSEQSQTEVPIAGIVDGHFVSRRIDRLILDDAAKIVRILDYKTDTDTQKFRQKYIAQLHEYADLLRQIYPDYKILCYILWLHNWTLERL